MTPAQLFGIEVDGLDHYLMFGANGSGDPVCLDTKNGGEIIYLNHDNDFERIYINKSIAQFAFSLIYYRNFILSLIDKSSTDYSRRKFSDAEFEKLRQAFLQVDKTSLGEGCFWAAELDGLVWERDND